MTYCSFVIALSLRIMWTTSIIMTVTDMLTTITYADEFHVVSPGPCLQEGDTFCTKRVANSMCSTEKNECFCKPGYVSIQESYGITCKTREFKIVLRFRPITVDDMKSTIDLCMYTIKHQNELSLITWLR